MPPAKFRAVKRISKKSRAEQLKRARLCKGKGVEITSPPSPSTSTPPPTTTSPTPTKSSASKRKLNLSTEFHDSPINYIIFDLHQLQNIFNSLICPKCFSASLAIHCEQDQHQGMAASIQISCSLCDDVVADCNTSKKATSHAYDVNRRATMAFLNLGLGHAALQGFCEVFGMKPLGETSFQSHQDTIYSAADKAKESLLDEAAVAVRAAYQQEGVTPDEDGMLDITVSYDGSWPTRGHRSKHGVGCVVESLTGLVIDYEAMTLYCQRCETIGSKLKEADPEEYRVWFDGHSAHCDINHNKSSGAMEVEAASIMWQRSCIRKFRYSVMISDGDCKTFNELIALQPYGPGRDVQKEECINHFAKRVGTALRNVTTVEKAKGVTLGGNAHGSLTKKKMDKFQNYFQSAILGNKGSLEGMRTAVWATYFHAVSTDDRPQHHDCPSGINSWCAYNKALAQKLPPPPHKTSILLNEKVAAAIKPVYERLTSDELLGRCMMGKTQNANESLHSVIWGFCPKTIFVGARRVRLALYLGSGQFNIGHKSLLRLLEEMSLDINRRTCQLGLKRDEERVARAERLCCDAQRRRREKRRVAHLQAQAAITAEGGPSYASGAF